ncbi:GNAT family N-acetyltransferase [Arthrobacter oryzae]|uniref:N-acetyltransferase n=1 Tax=Arthrobacter oryzae TaxID=409290 RepID=A0A3N0C5T5_9MICC|nr:GNAT family protein [Arthrobacter oryzae]RNL58322.1 N-acetyltransferase [Arthrobacter oryzae]
MPVSNESRVVLEDVTEAVLVELLALATSDAGADEVTPPLGGTAGWNTERISWFRAYHRAAAAGLEGPAAEKTWAVYSNGEIAGSIRLRRTGPADQSRGRDPSRGRDHESDSQSLETGIWLGRAMRGTGIGAEAFRLVRDLALAAGARELRAQTSPGNHAAQALLRAGGAEIVSGISPSAGADTPAAPVRARIRLG